MLTLIRTLADIGSNVLRGLREITPNLFESSDTQSPETLFPRNRFVDELVDEELAYLQLILQRGRDLYPDMTLDEECFFVADWIIPEQYQLRNESTEQSTEATTQWRDFNGSFTTPANINVGDFKRWVSLLANHGLLSEQIHDTLQNNAQHYCQEVALERQYRAFYLQYRAVITALDHGKADRNIIEHYFRIPKPHRRTIENELALEQDISTTKVLLSTFFTSMLLSAGFIEPRIFRPNPTETTLDPHQVDLPATQATALSILQFVPQVLNNCIAQLDKALIPLMMLPVASAAKTSSLADNALYKMVPEFLEGTKQYSKYEERKLHALMTELHTALYPFLKTNTDKSKVIVLGELHGQSLYVKLMLMNYMKQWQLSRPAHQLDLRFYQEMGDKNNVNSKFAIPAYEREFNMFFDGQYHHNAFENFMNQYCLVAPDSSPTSFKGATNSVMQCTVPTAIAYGYNFKIANIADIKLSQKEEMQIRHYDTFDVCEPFDSQVVFFSEPHDSFKAIDLVITPTIVKAIDNENIGTLQKTLDYGGTGITIFVIGKNHLEPVVDALKALNQPHVALNLADSNNRVDVLSLHRIYQKHCFKPLTKCPKKYGAEAPEQHGQKFCLLNQSYDPDHCDNFIHNSSRFFTERAESANDSKNAVQLASTLPNKFPKKLTDLFAPKKSIKFLHKEFARDQVAEKENELPKLEL